MAQPQARIDRINALAKKAKAEGLTPAEIKERKALREAYLRDFRAGFKQRLTTTQYFDQHGHEITPQKVKDEQRKKGWRQD
ncbi:DUF896 domain-containing protein [Lacticaseibacillus baoqingensis]|uniref:UPF0291 protein ACFQ5J_03925 n=1 Tax=Lacticaseibacillus baoqingensis TaxID=2486013 RepID=A0ABW4E7G0_9LACO|nr:DUF896 domain-containing protein [Lacticaseibacillus baoqingensis]